MRSKTSISAFLAAWLVSTGEAFVSSTIYGRRAVALNLEDHIADMIDGELHRLRHKHEHDQEWLDKQRQWSKMEPTLPAGFEFNDVEGTFDVEGKSVPGFTAGVDRGISPVQRRKDEKMANDDPMRYCADRCVSTGNCDVFEDMFDMDPKEVIKFCKECVLSEDEELCDVPGSFFDDDSGLHP